MAGLSAVSGVQHDQIVPVYDFSLVCRAELFGEFAGGPAEELGDLLGVEVDQSAGHGTAVAVPQFDRVPGAELALDRGDSGRQEDFLPCTTAVTAPSSRIRAPCGVEAWASQSSRSAERRPVLWKYVPVPRPARASAARTADVRTTGTPAAAAILAASTLVTMPPVPTPALPAEPIWTCSMSAGPCTSSMRAVPGREGLRRRDRRRPTGARAGRPGRDGRRGRRGGRCRRSGSHRWRRCRSR